MSNAVNVRKAAPFIAWVALASLFGCGGPSPDDQAKLVELEKRFGNHYEFSFQGDSYLLAKLKKGATNSDQETEEMYKLFLFQDFKKRERRSSSFVYLNIYDSKGNFLYQYFYDPQSQFFRKEEKVEHY